MLVKGGGLQLCQFCLQVSGCFWFALCAEYFHFSIQCLHGNVGDFIVFG